MNLEKTEFIIWNDDFSVGNSLVDTQHKGLFELTNNFARSVHEEIESESFGETIARIKSYVITHFSDEEELMEKGGFPETAEHRKLHEDFIDKFNSLCSDFIMGEACTKDVLELLQGWLKEHIMEADQKFAPYIK